MPMSLRILLIYAIWFAAIFYVHRLCKNSRSGSVGVPLSYLVTMTFLHCGGLLYAIPGYSHLRVGGNWYLRALDFTEQMVLSGVLASGLSVVGIAVGCYLCSDKRRPGLAPAAIPPSAPLHLRRGPPPFHRPPARYLPVPMLLVACGMTAFILTGLVLTLPSIQSIVMAGRNLAVVGVCLGLWLAWQRRSRAGVKLWIAMTLLVPAAYLLGFGFLSYGFTAVAIFLSFWLSSMERSWRNKLLRFTLIALGAYASLSIFVGYMEVRNALREVLWNLDASLSERFATVIAQLAHIKPLNPLNFTQLDWINIRLNQNMVIGKAMRLHELAPNLQENGMGILISLFAWVPRFLWPNKPGMGGNDFVEKHTGMSFNDATTIGAGPVFELFVNFGLVGVFVGSIVLGWILRWMDAYCARQLQRREVGRFIRGFLVSVSLINPMSLIFFLVSSGVASWILGTGIMMALDILAPAARRPPRPRPDLRNEIAGPVPAPGRGPV